jgi:GNAT superfamily N-acetyltransferase
MDIIIRRAEVADFPAVYALFREFAVFQKTPEKLHITLDQLIADEAYFQCFVAEERPFDGTVELRSGSSEGGPAGDWEGGGATVGGREIVGFATFFVAYYSWTGKAIYLDDLYVRESSRKYGIGKKLLFSVIDFSKENGCKTVRWLVSRWNVNAIEFYKSIGAEVYETEMVCVLENH